MYDLVDFEHSVYKFSSAANGSRELSDVAEYRNK